MEKIEEDGETSNSLERREDNLEEHNGMHPCRQETGNTNKVNTNRTTLNKLETFLNHSDNILPRTS